jgi:acyl-CoA synthetase (AMP-forming)/AMP-acid ligase II
MFPPATARAFEDVVGPGLHSMWSSTEAAGSLTFGWGYGNGSRIVPGVDVRLVDKNGDDVGQGGVGEMLLRGDNITLGYWSGPGAWSGSRMGCSTAAMFCDKTGLDSSGSKGST